MPKKKPLPPFVTGLKDQVEIINNIVDMFESECDHPHCVAMRKFLEKFPVPEEAKSIGRGKAQG